VSSRPRRPGAAVEAAIITLRRRTRDTAPWSWINVPNDTPERWRYVMFGELAFEVR
jgi:hypothetical protein